MKFNELQEERYRVEKEMVNLADERLLENIGLTEARIRALALIQDYALIINELKQIGGWY